MMVGAGAGPGRAKGAWTRALRDGESLAMVLLAVGGSVIAGRGAVTVTAGREKGDLCFLLFIRMRLPKAKWRDVKDWKRRLVCNGVYFWVPR